ncbi:MAG TPA: two-component regulator propeller domain-containing protein [Chitinophagaceae bacterium]|nr:two-component regulator propeller domain-containing protein [Chitinophagaceae bacterium]
MSLTRQINLLLFLLFLPHFISAQLNSDNLVQYKEKEGVPALQVNKVMADRHGYIWLATNNGLARFDGYGFKRFYFNPNDSSSFHGLVSWSLFEDRSGLIWVGAGPSYLNSYNPVTKKFREHPFAHLLKRESNTEIDVRDVVQDKRGRVYFGIDTYYGDPLINALVYKDEQDDSLKLFNPPPGIDIPNVLQLTHNDNDEIWLVTYLGVLRIDKDRRISKFSLLDSLTFGKNDPVEDLVFDKEGQLWAISRSLRLFQVSKNLDQVFIHDIPDLRDDNTYNNVGVLLTDEQDNIWIGSDGGLSYFNKSTKTVSKFTKGSNTVKGKLGVVSLAKDDFGNLWAGCFVDGLLKYEDKPQFRSFTYKPDSADSFTPGWASLLVEDKYGKLWVATGGSGLSSGLNAIDLKSGVIKAFRFSDMKPQLAGLNAMWVKTDGNIGVQGGFFRNDRFIRRYFSFSENPKVLDPLTDIGISDTTYIFFQLQDSKGNHWVGTFNGLFRKEKYGDSYRRYDLSKMPGANNLSNEVTSLFESKKHGLWIQTNQGLFLYDYGTDKMQRHCYDNRLGDVLMTHDINSLYEGEDGIVWIGTWQGGLARYDVSKKSIKTYTRDNGLPSMSIQSILPHKESNSLWLSTFEGLSRFDLATEKFSNYSPADGIQGLLFADGAALITRDGHYIFGGNNGITVFKPEEIRQVSIPPRVFLTDFKLFNQSVLPGEGSVLKKPVFETDQITLSHDQNNISFDFLAIHYSDPSRNQYAYKLENYDPDWLEVGSLHSAYYSNLPPGKYVFRVKAANDKGVWNEKGVTVRITVLPPWWRTIWAYLGYALMLGILIYFGDRYFRHRLLEKEREKNRNRELEQAREIQKAYSNLEKAHEALKATQKQLVQSEKMASLGELTAGIAHEIQNPLNFVNNFSEVNRELSDELIEAATKGNLEEVKQLAYDIRLNDEKIRDHGKRADSIVKSMLLHSRTNTGQKEPVDLNALVDEYVRLSYHGMRARDKDFNAGLDTKYDDKLGKVNAIPQEIGRVILNLVNNAFYAVTERRKIDGNGFEPKVNVSTRTVGNDVEITVADNGTGIPESIKDKIMQPFFTTKPTGEGTGLGLSLSYDIIKAHGGEIRLETPEPGGTRFIVRLPISS